MTTHSSTLGWEIAWTEEPGGLQPMGLQESDMTEHSSSCRSGSQSDALHPKGFRFPDGIIFMQKTPEIPHGPSQVSQNNSKQLFKNLGMQGHQQFCFTRNYHFISFCLSFINCKVSLMKSSCKFVLGLPWWLNDEESACQCRRPRFSPWVGKIPWRRQWQLNPVFLPGKSHGQRSLSGYSPWGRKRDQQDLVTKQQQLCSNHLDNYHPLLGMLPDTC